MSLIIKIIISLSAAAAIFVFLSFQSPLLMLKTVSHWRTRPGKLNKDRKGPYQNPVPTVITGKGTTLDTLRRWIGSDNIREPRKKHIFTTDLSELKRIPEKGILFVWIGHSTLLIALEGKVFLTDPVWSRRASPHRIFGPARFFDPPLAQRDLPIIDGIIISHDHYDHLDSSTIMELNRRETTFYVPMGVAQRLRAWEIPEGRIREMVWWESISLGDNHRLVAAPARHFSGRGLFDKDMTLWCSWIIMGRSHRVYYGGDSGLFPGLETIGERYGPFDLTFLDTGAYDKNWGEIHMGPDGAVTAHRLLQGRVLVPIHWGTFNLAIHPWTEPAEMLTALSKEKQIAVSFPRPGQIIRSPDLVTNSRWWDEGQ